MNRWFEGFLAGQEEKGSDTPTAARAKSARSLPTTKARDSAGLESHLRPTLAGLEASMRRLIAADVRIAIFITTTDAGLHITDERIVRGEDDARAAWRDGAVVFDAGEMFAYIRLNPEERRLFRSLKTSKQK